MATILACIHGIICIIWAKITKLCGKITLPSLKWRDTKEWMQNERRQHNIQHILALKPLKKLKNKQKVGEVFHSVASKYDVMNDVMSAGMHRGWKRFAVDMSGVKAGDKVLDIAGGSGDLSKLFAKKVGARWRSDINRHQRHHVGSWP